MKILSYLEEGNMIRITTDYEPMPVFVYFKDKFKNMTELENEINKKIKEVDEKNTKKAKKIKTLLDELKEKVK